MPYEQKDNSGTLFQNKDKKSENHPDYSGSIKVNGRDMWISGWRKTTKDGKPFLSLSVKAKDGTSDRPAPPRQQAVKQNFPNNDLSDEIPFAPEFR